MPNFIFLFFLKTSIMSFCCNRLDERQWLNELPYTFSHIHLLYIFPYKPFTLQAFGLFFYMEIIGIYKHLLF